MSFTKKFNFKIVTYLTIPFCGHRYIIEAQPPGGYNPKLSILNNLQQELNPELKQELVGLFLSRLEKGHLRGTQLRLLHYWGLED